MGIWNKTCAISNLPIQEGEAAYGFLLTENAWWRRSDSMAYWTPLLLPFQCIYAGYGRGKNSSHHLQILLDQIRPKLVEDEFGIYRKAKGSKTAPVTKEKLNEETFFTAVAEGTLRVNAYGMSRVDFVMIRKDILDPLLMGWEQETFTVSAENLSQLPTDYKVEELIASGILPRKYTFADVLAEVPQYLDNFMVEYNAMPQSARSLTLTYGIFSSYADSHSLISPYMTPANYGMDGLVFNPFVKVALLMRAGNREKAYDIMVESLRGAHTAMFMAAARKVWIPAAHEGNDSVDTAPHRALSMVITEHLSKG